jgi:colicin import membrane protein
VALKLAFNRSEPGFWISGVAHTAMLGAALFAFSSPHFPEAQEGIPVEIFTDAQFSQMTRGEKEAREVQAVAKPRVDRVAEVREPRDPGEAQKETPAPPRRPAEAKVDEKEVEAALPPPRPDPKIEAAKREEASKREEAERAEKAEAMKREEAARAEKAAVQEAKAKAEAKAQAEREERAKAEAEAIEQAKAEAEAKARTEARRVAEAKAAEAKAKAEAEAKSLAEAKAKAEADAKAKAVAEAKAKAEAEAKRQAEAKAEAEAKAKRQAELADKFSPGDIRQLLQSKEKAASSGATGAEVNKTASLGTATGLSQKLSPSMQDALAGLLREQMERCYASPVGATAARVTIPILEVRFNNDGTLAREPRIVKAGPSATDQAVAEAALRAVRRCAPYRIPAQFAPYYEAWKYWNVEFEVGQT